MEEPKRLQVKMLGKTIGTASGWDEFDQLITAFYDFYPEADAGLPACGLLTVDYYNGTITADEVEGLDQQSFQIDYTLRNLSHT